jgi:hypothetical protein
LELSSDNDLSYWRGSIPVLSFFLLVVVIPVLAVTNPMFTTYGEFCIIVFFNLLFFFFYLVLHIWDPTAMHWAWSLTKTKKSNTVGKLSITKLATQIKLCRADEYKRVGSITGQISFVVQQQLQKQQ